MSLAELDQLIQEYKSRTHKTEAIILIIIAVLIFRLGKYFLPIQYVLPLSILFGIVGIILGFHADKVARELDLVCENHPTRRYLTNWRFKKELYRTGRCKSCGMQHFILDEKPEAEE